MRAAVRNAIFAVTAIGNLSLVACGGSDQGTAERPNATIGVPTPAPAPTSETDLPWSRPQALASAPATGVSADGTTIGRWSGGTITDAQGHKWTHGSFGTSTGLALMVDGVYANQAADVITIFGGLVWCQHTQGDWYTVVYPGVATPRTSAPGPAPSPAPAPAPAPATYSATISWSVPLLNTNGTSLTDVAGYRVYYGTNPSSLSNAMLVSGAGVGSVVVSGLIQGTYYFAVSTVNSSGVESAPSNPVSRTVP